jgi:hypothetical protein
MSLQPQTGYAVPERTAEVALAAFPKGNRYIQMRTELGTFFRDKDFARLYPECGQPAAASCRLALVTIMQFAENQTDREAADAVRARLDWKYALSLELEDNALSMRAHLGNAKIALPRSGEDAPAARSYSGGDQPKAGTCLVQRGAALFL